MVVKKDGCFQPHLLFWLCFITAAQKLREERREERKRREVEKKRLRDEEKRRRKVDRDRATKEPSMHRESSSARYDDDLAQFDDAEPAPTKPPVVKVLRNPVREHEPPAATTPKDSGTGVVPKSSAGTGGSHSKAAPVRSSTGGGSSARKDWDRPKLPRPSKDYPGAKEYSKHKAEQPASSHRRGSTGSDGRGQETSTPKASATTPATDDERSVVESSRGATSTSSTPAEGKNTSSEKDRERPSAPEESSQSRAKDPRAERRIRNKDRPSIEIYRPGMRRLSQKGTSSQEETPAATSKPTKSNSSSKPPA